MIVWKNHDRVIFCERNKIKKGWYYSMKKQAFNPYLPSWEYMERYVGKEVNDFWGGRQMKVNFEKAPKRYESHCASLRGKL